MATSTAYPQYEPGAERVAGLVTTRREGRVVDVQRFYSPQETQLRQVSGGERYTAPEGYYFQESDIERYKRQVIESGKPVYRPKEPERGIFRPPTKYGGVVVGYADDIISFKDTEGRIVGVQGPSTSYATPPGTYISEQEFQRYRADISAARYDQTRQPYLIQQWSDFNKYARGVYSTAFSGTVLPQLAGKTFGYLETKGTALLERAEQYPPLTIQAQFFRYTGFAAQATGSFGRFFTQKPVTALYTFGLGYVARAASIPLVSKYPLASKWVSKGAIGAGVGLFGYTYAVTPPEKRPALIGETLARATAFGVGYRLAAAPLPVVDVTKKETVGVIVKGKQMAGVSRTYYELQAGGKTYRADVMTRVTDIGKPRGIVGVYTTGKVMGGKPLTPLYGEYTKVGEGLYTYQGLQIKTGLTSKGVAGITRASVKIDQPSYRFTVSTPPITQLRTGTSYQMEVSSTTSRGLIFERGFIESSATQVGGITYDYFITTGGGVGLPSLTRTGAELRTISQARIKESEIDLILRGMGGPKPSPPPPPEGQVLRLQQLTKLSPARTLPLIEPQLKAQVAGIASKSISPSAFAVPLLTSGTVPVTETQISPTVSTDYITRTSLRPDTGLKISVATTLTPSMDEISKATAIQKVSQVQRIAQVQRVAQVQKVAQVSPFPPPPYLALTPVPPIVPNFGLPEFKPTTTRTIKRFRPVRFKTSYSPSISAVTFGITGKKPEELIFRTGLTLRPIIKVR